MYLNVGNMWTVRKKNTSTNNNRQVNKFIQNKLVIPKNINKKENIMGTKSFWGTPTWLLFHSLAEQINTKEKLINTLFVFHNDVNVKTGKSKSNNIVLYKYKSANLNKILELFMNRFFVSYIGNRQFNDWLKNKTKEKTQIFWNFYIKNLL